MHNDARFAALEDSLPTGRARAWKTSAHRTRGAERRSPFGQRRAPIDRNCVSCRRDLGCSFGTRGRGGQPWGTRARMLGPLGRVRKRQSIVPSRRRIGSP